jgi:diamine N-acetyltransferase
MIENPDKQVVGIIDLCNFDPFHNRAEVGIVVADPYQNKGIGKLALQLLIEHCFDFLGIHQLFAYIDVTNEACRKLFKKCGFIECAYLKEWMRTGKNYRDVVMVQCINS